MDEAAPEGEEIVTVSDNAVAWGPGSNPGGEASRDAILSRLADAEVFSAPAIRREYVDAPVLPPNPAVLVQEMKESLEDYGAQVTICDSEDALPEHITRTLEGLPSVVISGDAPLNWMKAIMAKHLVYLDSPLEPLDNDVLNGVSATLTASRLGIAPTGTIVLDGGPGQGRRIITLLPDTHIIVLYTDTIYATVPQAIRALAKYPTRPMTWISGPSATSDIELSRVDGVHGPRNLKVILCKRTKRGM